MQTRLRRFAFVIYLIMACSMAGIAQSRKVTGTVKDTEGLEVIWCHRNRSRNEGGCYYRRRRKVHYRRTVGRKKIKVTYVGSKDAVIDIGNRDVIDVVMTESDQSLDEVVAIGYAKVRKADLTGATASVSAEDLASRPGGYSGGGSCRQGRRSEHCIAKWRARRGYQHHRSWWYVYHTEHNTSLYSRWFRDGECPSANRHQRH